MHDTGAIVALLIFGATQTGALVYFAGTVAATLRDHDRRLDVNEADHKALLKVTAQIAAKEGIQL